MKPLITSAVQCTCYTLATLKFRVKVSFRVRVSGIGPTPCMLACISAHQPSKPFSPPARESAREQRTQTHNFRTTGLQHDIYLFDTSVPLDESIRPELSKPLNKCCHHVLKALKAFSRCVKVRNTQQDGVS